MHVHWLMASSGTAAFELLFALCVCVCLFVYLQSVWQGDAEEEHRRCGGGLPGHTHH